VASLKGPVRSKEEKSEIIATATEIAAANNVIDIHIVESQLLLRSGI
jgi:hypothetical protein